jgi:plasmid stabilization system protein ParE
MPHLSVEFDPFAIAEARAAYRWYRQRSMAAAERFIEELDAAVDSIGREPGRCPAYIDDTRRYLFRRFPYFLVYRYDAEHTQVVAVAHARRRPGYWRSRQ